MATINYQNLPSTSTPLNATNLNSMQVPDEGTWTPTINTIENVAPTITYTENRGRYFKMGKWVHVDFYIKGKITALNGTKNYGVIKGLPFSVDNVAIGERPLTVGVVYNILHSTTDVVFAFYNNYIRLQEGYGTGANSLIVTPGDYFEIGGAGWYKTT